MSFTRHRRIEKLEKRHGSPGDCFGAITILRYGPQDDEAVNAATLEAETARKNLIILNII